MAESEARDWVLVWVEHLHRRAGSKEFLGRRARAGRFDDGLLNSVLQPLGGTAYIPTVT